MLPATGLEDFDGEDLNEVWVITSPNPDQFIVEDGNLLLITTRPGKRVKNTIPNVFQLDTKLPKGD